MSENLNIKIKGIDPNRRPSVVNKNYIDIIFELSEKATKDWCVIFNDYFSKSGNNIRINPEEGNFVETWVRDMEDIPEALTRIKEYTVITNTKHTEKLVQDAESRKDSYNHAKSAASERLDTIISNLNFD